MTLSGISKYLVILLCQSGSNLIGTEGIQVDVGFTCHQAAAAPLGVQCNNVVRLSACKTIDFSGFFSVQLQDDPTAEPIESPVHSTASDDEDILADADDTADSSVLDLAADPTVAADQLSLGSSEHICAAGEGQITAEPLMEESEWVEMASDFFEYAEQTPPKVENTHHELSERGLSAYAGISSNGHTLKNIFGGKFFENSSDEGSLHGHKERDLIKVTPLPNVAAFSKSDPIVRESLSEPFTDTAMMDFHMSNEGQDAIPLKDYEIKTPTSHEGDHAERAIKTSSFDPRQVIRQIGREVTPTQVATRVEVILDPAELGKVRMLISPGDNPAVTILAERPETFDLLRRNIDLLSKELRDVGISGADISFSDGEEGWSSQNNFPAREPDSLLESVPQQYLENADPVKTTATLMNTGIDIRI